MRLKRGASLFCFQKAFSEVGADGFEPPKSKDSRFTVCPIWPLWKTPVSKASAKVHIFFQTAKCFAEKSYFKEKVCLV